VPRRRGRGGRLALWLTAAATFSAGAGVYRWTAGPPASAVPLAFHLDEVGPESGVRFVHHKQAVHPFFDNVKPYLQATSAAGCVCDVDHDGLVDVYLVDAGRGARNKLYRNAGGFRFVELSLPPIEDLNQDGFSTDCLFADVDGDGFDDLLVEWVVGFYPTDIGRDSYKGMNAELADIDNDGYPEIYVTNIFHPILPEGNMLWLNLPGSAPSGPRRFANVAAELGVKDGGWGWGAKSVDLDLDGDIDLIATNGFVSNNPKKEYWYQTSRLAGGTAEVIRDSAPP
jgi:hypothetical protein